MTGVELSREHPEAAQSGNDSRQPFFLEQARLNLKVDASKWLSGAISAGLDDTPALRSAYVNIKLDRAFQIRAGRFKRPSGRLAASALIDLPFRNRGLFDKALVKDAGWGRRALGLKLWGKLRAPKLRWEAAVMNSSEQLGVSGSQRLRGADFLGRVQYAPADWLTLALFGGHKITESRFDFTRPNVHLNAVGGDLRIKLGRLRFDLESMLAQNPEPPTPPAPSDRTPMAAGVNGHVRYNVRLQKGLTLQPVVAAEWADTDTDVAQDEAVRGVVGLNLLIGDHLRLLPQVEVIRPLGKVSGRSEVAGESYYLMLSGRI